MKYKGMKIITRDWMPEGEVWITNNEPPIEIFDTTFKKTKGSNQHAVKGVTITKFTKRLWPKRRHGILKKVDL